MTRTNLNGNEQSLVLYGPTVIMVGFELLRRINIPIQNNAEQDGHAKHMDSHTDFK